MKKHLLILVVLLMALNVCKGQTSNYRLLPDSNAYWIMGVSVEISQSGFGYTYKLDATANTTIINGETYTNMYGEINPWDNIYPWDLVGSYRSDSTGKTFFVWADSTDEHLLFDMSKNIGDTSFNVLCSSMGIHYFNNIIVEDTQLITIGSRLLKKIDFRYSDETPGFGMLHSWIEGIGNIEGFINPYQMGLNMSNLVCMSEYDTAWYPDFSLTPCDSLGLNIIKNNFNVTFNISPNPFTTSATIQCAKPLKSATLTIYDIFGQQVKKITNISGQTIILHREHLPSGLYFVRIEEEGRAIATEKIIIGD